MDKLQKLYDYKKHLELWYDRCPEYCRIMMEDTEALIKKMEGELQLESQ